MDTCSYNSLKVRSLYYFRMILKRMYDPMNWAIVHKHAVSKKVQKVIGIIWKCKIL